MSECGAENPEKCKFYKKSTYYDRCMFQSMELGNGFHCSCADAQCDRRKCTEKCDEEAYIEQKESDMPT